MRFTLSEDQQEIKRTAHDLLANRSTMAKVREAAEAGTYDDALARELGELGWPGIAVGEEHGGQGLGIVELCVLFAARSPRWRSRPAADPPIRSAGCPASRPASCAARSGPPTR